MGVTAGMMPMREGWSLAMGWKKPVCLATGDSRSPMPTAARAIDALIIAVGVGLLVMAVGIFAVIM